MFKPLYSGFLLHAVESNPNWYIDQRRENLNFTYELS